MIRATTNGVLKSYKSNLMHSFVTLNKARDTVLSQRNFNSYAEDPAAASQAFQLRRSFLRTSSQYTNSESVVRQYESAWNSLHSVVDMVDNQTENSAWSSVVEALNDPTGSGRLPLGQQLTQLADSIVQSMNTKYGDHYVFAGADGLERPFSWNDDGKLCYQGLPVDDPANAAKMEELSKEQRLVDIGLGLQEIDGEIKGAYDSALPGIYFLGYGVDDEGDPKNVASIIKELGTILSRCESDGSWSTDPNYPNDKENFRRLAGKLTAASDEMKEKRIEMDAKAAFVKSNHAQLEATADTLNEQIMGIEKCDLADAITSFSWAQYCYNAALKMGNSILGQSLMDYMN